MLPTLSPSFEKLAIRDTTLTNLALMNRRESILKSPVFSLQLPVDVYGIPLGAKGLKIVSTKGFSPAQAFVPQDIYRLSLQGKEPREMSASEVAQILQQEIYLLPEENIALKPAGSEPAPQNVSLHSLLVTEAR